MKTRRRFSADFKAKVALEACKEQKTISELSTLYKVHPNQITKWKAEFKVNMSQAFANGKDNTVKEQEEKLNGLYEQIGRLKVENDFLKKKL